MDCKFRFGLSSKGHRKDADKSRSRKDDDSLAESSHSKKTVKKAGNGVSARLRLSSSLWLTFSLLNLGCDFTQGHSDSRCLPLLTILGQVGHVLLEQAGRPYHCVLALLPFLTLSLSKGMTGAITFHSSRQSLCPAAGAGPLGRGQRETSMTCLFVAPRWW